MLKAAADKCATDKDKGTMVPLWIRGGGCFGWDLYDDSICSVGKEQKGAFANTVIVNKDRSLVFNTEGTDRSLYKSSNQGACLR